MNRTHSLKQSRSRTGTYLALSVIALIFIVPFAYALLTSFAQQQYVNVLPPLNGFTLENYQKVFETDIFRWTLNSFIVTFCVLIGNVLVNTPAAFALAKIKFPGRNIIFFIIIAMMMVPYQTCMIPLYIMMVNLGWLNTFYCMIIPFLFQGFLVFLMRQFFCTFPDELLEAAKIDGLSTAGAFVRIVLPNAKTALATQMIFSVTGTWNFLAWGATFLNKSKMYILPQGLNTLKNTYYTVPGYTMAGVVVMTIPMLLIFLLLQKQFVQGIAATGMKE